MITSVSELIQYVLDHVPHATYVNGEVKSASPDFSGGWYGDDGFIWLFNNHPRYPYARVYGRRLYGDGTWASPVRALSEIWNELPLDEKVDWLLINKEIKLNVSFGGELEKEMKRTRTVDTETLIQWHAAYYDDVLKYWQNKGVSKRTVHKFFLGAAQLFKGKPLRLVIPIPILGTGQYTFISKRWDQNDTLRHWRPANSPTTLWFADNDDLDSDTLHIVEGSGSLIAAYELGYTPVATSNAGAGYWDVEWCTHIFNKMPNLQKIVLWPDNDDTGRNHMAKVFNKFQKVCELENKELVYEHFIHESHIPEHFDLADYLDFAKEVDVVKQYTSSQLITLYEEDINPRLTSVFEDRIDYKKPEYEDILALDDLRDNDNPHSVSQVVDSYLTTGDPSEMLILKHSAGTGKTTATVNALQDHAREHIKDVIAEEQENFARADELEQDIKNGILTNPYELEHARKTIQKLRKPLDRRYAVMASPYRASYRDIADTVPHFDESMWYYFESRGDSNCKNFLAANRAQQQGYNVRLHVCGICPFAQECEKSGYLSQFEEMKKYPLTSIRHQHLMTKEITKKCEVLVIDEDIQHIVLNEQRFEAGDFKLPFGWDRFIPLERRKYIEIFIHMLRSVVGKGTQRFNHSIYSYELLSGMDLILRFDDWLNKRYKLSLGELLENIGEGDLRKAALTSVERLEDNEEASSYIEYKRKMMGSDELPRRAFDLVYEIIQAEFFNFQYMQAWNSRLHLLNRKLYVLPREEIPVRSKTKLIYMDATAEPELVSLMFEKKPLVVDPITKSNIKVTQLYGNTLGIGALTRNIWKTNDVIFENEDLEYPNNAVKIVHEVYNEIRKNHPDAKILFISHKTPADYFKKHAESLLDDNVVVAHYRSLRGLNEFADCDVGVLFGLPQKSEFTLRMQAQAWYHRDNQPLNFFTKRRTIKPLMGYGRSHEWPDTIPGLAVIEYEDHRVNTLYHSDVQSELVQAAYRIRATDHERYLYIVNSYPAMTWVDSVKSYRAFLGQATDHEKMTEWLRNYMQENYDPNSRWKYPGQVKALQAAGEADLGMSLSRFKVYYKEIKQELENEV